MVIKIKVVKFECSTEHSNISSYCFTPRNSVQKCINTSKIFEIMGSMSTPFVESKDESLRANISHLKFATFSYSTQIKDLKVAYHLPYRWTLHQTNIKAVIGTIRTFLSLPPIWAVIIIKIHNLKSIILRFNTFDTWLVDHFYFHA